MMSISILLGLSLFLLFCTYLLGRILWVLKWPYLAVISGFFALSMGLHIAKVFANFEVAYQLFTTNRSTGNPAMVFLTNILIQTSLLFFWQGIICGIALMFSKSVRMHEEQTGLWRSILAGAVLLGITLLALEPFSELARGLIQTGGEKGFN